VEQPSVTEQIIKWARESLPEWQNELVRRYLETGSLSKGDIDEVYLAVIAKHGIDLPEGGQPPPLRKPELGAVSGAPQEPLSVAVKSIRELKGVNQIPDGSSLTFGETGLTVIYGENGAGKSGWSRLLKRACRAKDVEEPILPNVYETYRNGHATAVFEVLIEGQGTTELPWSDDASTNDILTNVTVFDSKAAGAIIGDENTFYYVPDAMNVFSELAGAIGEIRDRLQGEKLQPSQPNIAGIDPASPVARQLSELPNSLSIDDLASMASWNDANSERLRTLTAQLAQINTGDLPKRIETRKAEMRRVQNLVGQVSARYQALTESSLEVYASQGRQLIECQKAAEIVSKEKHAEEPLAGVGSSAWEMLYRAAKAFSEEIAYPGRAYPPADEGDHCVLCMQELSPEAQRRMTRFRDFVEGSVQRELDEARRAVKVSREKLETLFSDEAENAIRAALEELEPLDETVATRLNEFVERSSEFKSMALSLLEGRDSATIEPSLENPEEYTIPVITRLKEAKDDLEAALDPAAADAIKKEHANLQSRKAAFDFWADIEAYWNALQEARKYEAALNQLSTTAITRQGKEMMSAIVNRQLNSAVADELSELGAERLSLQLSGRGEKGQVKYRYTLGDGATTDNIDLRRVLSEGEQRVVALAGFLAEENLTGRSSTIVFDDPVSSLDHLFRQKIAARLVKEAEHRQVIVFTHDIAFLVALSEKCAGQEMAIRTLRRAHGAVGRPNDQLPWHAMRVNERISHIRKELAEIRDVYDSNQDEYDRKAGYLYGLLRETWEAAVEESLFNRTIQRHGNEVKTQSLRQVTVTDEMYFAIDAGMTKCSEWMIGHDKSKLLSEHRPSPREFSQDIEALEAFLKHIKSLRKTVESARATTPAGFALGDKDA
jgi:energy-coupling factor transporter ATP-binding protein EcfA2